MPNEALYFSQMKLSIILDIFFKPSWSLKYTYPRLSGGAQLLLQTLITVFACWHTHMWFLFLCLDWPGSKIQDFSRRYTEINTIYSYWLLVVVLLYWNYNAVKHPALARKLLQHLLALLILQLCKRSNESEIAQLIL